MIKTQSETEEEQLARDLWERVAIALLGKTNCPPTVGDVSGAADAVVSCWRSRFSRQLGVTDFVAPDDHAVEPNNSATDAEPKD